MVNIADYKTIVNYRKYGNTNRIRYIVIHYTAGTVDNGTAALGNAKYFYNVNRQASAHYFVDSGDTIYRVVADEDIAWHCGGGLQGSNGHTFYQKCTNTNSIGIEICSYAVNGVYYLKDRAVDNAVELTKYLMKKYDIDVDHVITHFDVTGKTCPAPFIINGHLNAKWYDFKNRLVEKKITADMLTDISGHYAESHIRKLVDYGVVKGYEDLTFKPDADITRAEFAVMIDKALEDVCGVVLGNTKNFADTAGHWANNYICRLATAGVVNGNGDGTFSPDEKITRGHAAIMACNMLLACGIKMREAADFTDTVDADSRNHIKTLRAYGIVNGDGDNTFKPNDNITRGQAAIIIANCLSALGK